MADHSVWRVCPLRGSGGDGAREGLPGGCSGVCDLKPLVDIVDKYGTDAVISATAALVDPSRADVAVCTAHGSKGLEWESVKIGDDYPTDGDREDTANVDAMVAYVAVTRAKLLLDRGCLAWIDKQTLRLKRTI